MRHDRDGRNESGRRRPGGFKDHFDAHAKGLSAVAIATLVGVVATFLAQILSARYLAPSEFGLFAAFLVIVNVAAVGSSALQNIVTVQTASALLQGAAAPRRRWPVEAISVGLVGGAGIAVASPLLASSLDTTIPLVLVAATSIPLTFVFADALGLLQGSGRVTSAVWWTTVAQLARVALIALVILLGAGLAGMIGSVIVSIALCLVGAVWSARKILRPREGAFSTTGATIVALTVAFAWLTASDVFFLRAYAPEELAGTYAAATVLVRAGFLVPSTLSLYLLPRFVRNRDNHGLARAGVLVTLALSLLTSIAMIIVFALFGDWLIQFLYGDAYAAAAALLVPASLAYVPWIAAQGLLIKMTSFASKRAAAVLIAAVVAQWILFTTVVPDIHAMLVGFGLIGIALLAGFLLLDAMSMRSAAVSESR